MAAEMDTRTAARYDNDTGLLRIRCLEHLEAWHATPTKRSARGISPVFIATHKDIILCEQTRRQRPRRAQDKRNLPREGQQSTRATGRSAAL